MPVGRAQARDEAWRPTCDRHDVNERLAAFPGLIADRQLRAVG